MVSITSEYGLYLYTGKVDMRKGIDGLCGIVGEALGHNTRKPKSVFIFSGRKSEKSVRLNRRRDDDDRNQGSDNFAGTAGSVMTDEGWRSWKALRRKASRSARPVSST